jgi:hypothetical protein
MSRYHTTGIDPENGEPVNVYYGWDQVPGFKSGYFFQVFSTNEDVIREDPSGEGLLLNEGFLVGLTKDYLKLLAKRYNVTLKKI